MKRLWSVSLAFLVAVAYLVPAGAQAAGHATAAPRAGAPYRLWERVRCAAPPAAGAVTVCTISEGVINRSSHRLSFTQPVVNQIAPNVRVIATSSTVGTVAVQGSTVVWKDFVVVPGRQVTATIRVAVSVQSTLTGASVQLSDGISAVGVDLVTGQRIQVRFGGLKTATRTARRRSSDPGHRAVGALPKTGGGAP